METASAPSLYRPTRPSPRATAREFLCLFARARHASRVRPDPVPPGSGSRGSGSRGAVLVIPTLFRGDRQTVGLRAAIARAGYASFGWNMGTDWGPTPRLMDGLEARLLALAETHGPIALVGLSMGGLFCRWLAFRHPQSVRQVITVCSPFRAPIDSFWLPLRPVLKVWPVRGLDALAQELARPLPVPSVSLFSKRDGIVARESCFDPRFPEACFEIDGPHVTIANDPSVRAIVLQQLNACHPVAGCGSGGNTSNGQVYSKPCAMWKSGIGRSTTLVKTRREHVAIDTDQCSHLMTCYRGWVSCVMEAAVLFVRGTRTFAATSPSACALAVLLIAAPTPARAMDGDWSGLSVAEPAAARFDDALHGVAAFPSGALAVVIVNGELGPINAGGRVTGKQRDALSI